MKNLILNIFKRNYALKKICRLAFISFTVQLFQIPLGFSQEYSLVKECFTELAKTSPFPEKRSEYLLLDDNRLLVLNEGRSFTVTPTPSGKYVFAFPGNPTTFSYEHSGSGTLNESVHPKSGQVSSKVDLDTPSNVRILAEHLGQKNTIKPPQKARQEALDLLNQFSKELRFQVQPGQHIEHLQMKLKEKNDKLQKRIDKFRKCSAFNEDQIKIFVNDNIIRFGQIMKNLEGIHNSLNKKVVVNTFNSTNTSGNGGVDSSKSNRLSKHAVRIDTKVDPCVAILRSGNQMKFENQAGSSQLLKGKNFLKRKHLLIEIIENAMDRILEKDFKKNSKEAELKNKILSQLRKVRAKIAMGEIKFSQSQNYAGDGISHGFTSKDGNFSHFSLIFTPDFEAKYFNDPVFGESTVLRSVMSLGEEMNPNSPLSDTQMNQAISDGNFSQGFYLQKFVDRKWRGSPIKTLQAAYRSSKKKGALKPEAVQDYYDFFKNQTVGTEFKEEALLRAEKFESDIFEKHRKTYEEFFACEAAEASMKRQEELDSSSRK